MFLIVCSEFKYSGPHFQMDDLEALLSEIGSKQAKRATDNTAPASRNHKGSNASSSLTDGRDLAERKMNASLPQAGSESVVLQQAAKDTKSLPPTQRKLDFSKLDTVMREVTRPPVRKSDFQTDIQPKPVIMQLKDRVTPSLAQTDSHGPGGCPL